jgi:hypothetical protein
MSDDQLSEVEVDNPKKHYMGERPTVKVKAIKISDREILEQTLAPGGSVHYAHRYFDGRAWRQCRSCGDLVGIPELSRGGTWPTPDHIRKGCSKLGQY